ncbi:MAG TPA: hypothetical protein VJK72_03565 [Candidatus Nanoarchaeia archaeon]|nr:hypothetical protein [Candidatus Nanoarchaeia archaeon]
MVEIDGETSDLIQKLGSGDVLDVVISYHPPEQTAETRGERIARLSEHMNRVCAWYDKQGVQYEVYLSEVTTALTKEQLCTLQLDERVAKIRRQEDFTGI